jgi:hypothetical protein
LLGAGTQRNSDRRNQGGGAQEVDLHGLDTTGSGRPAREAGIRT